MNEIHPDLVRRDQRVIPDDRDEIRLFCALRDEALRMPYFLYYYRRLGVNRFFMVNNNSVDGSEEFLLQQSDCHVFYTDASFGASRTGVAWVNSLLDAYGEERWNVVADADELLVYPSCEEAGLQEFCAWLDRSGYEGVFTLLLDMYSKLPIKDVAYRQGEDFCGTCPYYDRDYHLVPRIGIPGLRPAFPPFEHIGGPRLRLCFAGQNTAAVWPRLRVKLLHRLLNLAHSNGLLKNVKAPEPATQAFKVPLVKWQRGYAYITNHRLNPIKLAPVTGALLHFKYFQDFGKRVNDALATGEHFGNSSEYKRYAKLLAANPKLSLFYEGSVAYHESADLVRHGLITRAPLKYSSTA
jgi:hypothetical protein